MASQNGVATRVDFSKKTLVRDELKTFPLSAQEFNEEIRERQAAGQKIYNFAFGQSPFPVMEEMAECLKEHSHQCAYLAACGLRELRERIVEFHKRYDGLNFDASQVVVGPGSKELISNVLKVFNGEVLLLSPTWAAYKTQAILAHKNPITIPVNLDEQWRLSPQLLEQTIKEKKLENVNKILIICDPDYPTGTAYAEEHWLALTEVCRRYGVIVLNDEIYGRLRYDKGHISLTKYYPEGTILSAGFSKWASAGGWRLGYQIFPKGLEEMLRAMRDAADNTYSSAPAPAQYAIAQALQNTDAVDSYINHTTRILSAMNEYCCRELESAGVKVLPARGAYVIFPDFEVVRPALAKKGVNTGQAMCQLILDEAGCALRSGGPAFLHPVERLTTCLCYVGFDGKVALNESRKLGLDKPITEDFLKIYCSAMYEGIQALKSWVQKNTSA